MGWWRAWCRRAPSSAAKLHTLRGLHFQESPLETKLVRCTTGAAFVVASDLREDSPARLRWPAPS